MKVNLESNIKIPVLNNEDKENFLKVLQVPIKGSLDYLSAPYKILYGNKFIKLRLINKKYKLSTLGKLVLY